MENVYYYFRLLRFEFLEMAQQMNGEMAGLLAVLTIACGWFCLRGHKIQR